jgi:LacI family transcriptional regulator
MGRRPITQKEIADRLGVSIATVSRTLNDLPGVSPQVRARVLNTAKEMGYSPDIRARSLVTSVTHTVAFVVHMANHTDNEDPFYPVIMAGAEAYLSQRNYHILLTTLDDQFISRPQEFSVISQRRVDGLILAGPDIPAAFVLGLISAGIPVVLVDNRLTQTAVNCVLCDSQGGAYSATRHLLEQGHTRVVFLSGPQEWVSNRERVRGYRDAMEEANLETLIIRGTETTIASGNGMMKQALGEYPDMTAVCAVNDAVAIGAIRAASGRGLRVPEDVSVMGFDDISWASMNEPPLTTVHVFKRRMGQLAAQHLLSAIRSPDAPPAKIVVSTELVLRDSCCRRI